MTAMIHTEEVDTLPWESLTLLLEMLTFTNCHPSFVIAFNVLWLTENWNLKSEMLCTCLTRARTASRFLIIRGRLKRQMQKRRNLLIMNNLHCRSDKNYDWMIIVYTNSYYTKLITPIINFAIYIVCAYSIIPIIQNGWNADK